MNINNIENREAYLKYKNLDKLSLGGENFDMIDDSDPRAIYRSYDGNPPKKLLDALVEISEKVFFREGCLG